MKKTLFLFALMSVFLLTGCGNDDILDGVADTDSEETSAEGMPFSATINATDVVVEDGCSDSPSGPAKALDDPGTSGKTINFRFKVNEKVALVYTVGSTKYLVQANVASIESNGEKANITATLTGNPTTGTHVTAIFPYSAVDATTKDIKPDLLKNATQLGTIADISGKYDVRKGSSQFMIKNGKVSFINACVMHLQYAICKLSFKSSTNANLNIAKLYVYDENNNVITTVKPASATSSMFVAFKPTTNKTKFIMLPSLNATAAPTKRVLNTNLVAGYYYRPTIKSYDTPVNIDEDIITDEMKQLIIGHNGNIYLSIKTCRDAAEKERAMIAYVGKDAAARCEKGLAIALVDLGMPAIGITEADMFYAHSVMGLMCYPLTSTNTKSMETQLNDFVKTWAEKWENGYNEQGNGYGYMSGYMPATTTRGWRAPSVVDFQYVMKGLGGYSGTIKTAAQIKTAGNITGMNYAAANKTLNTHVGNYSGVDINNGKYYDKSGGGSQPTYIIPSSSGWNVALRHPGLSYTNWVHNECYFFTDGNTQTDMFVYLTEPNTSDATWTGCTSNWFGRMASETLIGIIRPVLAF